MTNHCPHPSPFVLTAILLAVASCGGEGDEVAEVSSDVCASGLQWVGGDEESPRMHPGRDCIGCHTDEGEGPRFNAAGTVFSAYDEADDCFGVEGALIEIVDANRATYSATTNEAGNFFFEKQAIATPVTASITYDGNTLEMTTPAPSSNCASCHTASGLGGAAGRIVVP